LAYTKVKCYVKGVNAKSLLIEGIAPGALFQIGQRRGKVDISVIPLDDKKFYLGIDFQKW